MSHVLFAVLPERGHIHPFLGAAAELLGRGHRVSFWAPRDIRALLAPYFSRGTIDVFAPEGAAGPSGEHRGAAFTALLEDPVRLRAWIAAMLVDSVEEAIPPLAAHLRSPRNRPDVVVIDPMYYAAAIAAEEADVPWLGLSTSLNPAIGDAVVSELVRTLRALDESRHALFARHGMKVRFRVSDVLSARGTFVLSTTALLGRDLPDDGAPLVLVGSSLPPAREAPEDEAALLRRARDESAQRPLVFVSFGSQAYHQPRHLGALTRAARSVDATFVMAVGELATTGFASSPNVIAVPFAPQLELLRSAALLVTHGGANSVHEALSLGVPMLVSPICNDQPHNASLVASAGAGRVLDLGASSLDERELVDVLHALLERGAPERDAARALAVEYAAAGGASRIADVVLAATTTGRLHR